MNHTNLSNFIQGLKRITLDPQDSHRMRAQLSSYADLYTVTPGVTRKVARTTLFSYRFAFAGALVLLLLISGTGVTFAAQNSLPGQPFYAVKVDVTEPLQVALTPTTAGKAAVENMLADRRLTEAATLAAQSKLTPQTQEYLQTEAQSHIAASNAESASLTASGDTEAAVAIRTDLEARLSAHAQLLAIIAPRLAAAGEASSSEATLALLQDVQSASTNVAHLRAASAIALAAPAVPGTHAPAFARAKVAATTTAPHDTSVDTAAPATIMAIVSQDARVAQEEGTLLRKQAAVLALLPPAKVAATTTATTTAKVTATSTPESLPVSASTTDSTSESLQSK